MQRSPAEADSTAMREIGSYRVTFAVKADAAKAEALSLGQNNPDPARGGDGVRHESFPASLVDGRAISIGDYYAESAGAGRHSGSKSCRSTANHENIGIEHCFTATSAQTSQSRPPVCLHPKHVGVNRAPTRRSRGPETQSAMRRFPNLRTVLHLRCPLVIVSQRHLPMRKRLMPWRYPHRYHSAQHFGLGSGGDSGWSLDAELERFGCRRNKRACNYRIFLYLEKVAQGGNPRVATIVGR
jgi:hypothetical protein